MQGRGGADLLAVVVIIGAAQAVQGAGSRRCGLLLYAAGQMGRRWCGLLLAWSSGAALAVLIFPGAGGGRNIRVLCPKQGEKKKPRAAAQVVRVSLWACVVGAGLLLIRQGHGGGILPFAGGVRFSTLPGSALGVGLELSEL